MYRRNRVCWVVALSAIILLLLNVTQVAIPASGPELTEESACVASIPHGPIVIIGDDNFTLTAQAEGWDGDGSPQTPYIIENLDIDLGPTPVASINISHTRSHFIIRGCNLNGPAASPSYGIYLENVTNAQVVDNEVTDFSHGVIARDRSMNIEVSDNNCSYNSYDIDFRDCNSITVSDNICNGNPFIGFYGIFLHSTNSSTVTGNTCNNNSMTGIYIYNCSLVNVADNTCNYNDFGIYMQELGWHNATDNICEGNSNAGLCLHSSVFNAVAGNTIANNSARGFYVHTSADNNDILWNLILANIGSTAEDYSTGNNFTHNFWSAYSGTDADQDGIGDTAFAFTGNSDPYPLMFSPFPPEWAQVPTDQVVVVEHGDFFEYTLEFVKTAITAPYQLWVSDPTTFMVGTGDTIVSIVPLPKFYGVYEYPLQIKATNIYGFVTWGSFIVTVRDRTPPLLTSQDDVTYTLGDIAPVLRWNMSDEGGVSFTLYRNGTVINHRTGFWPTINFTLDLKDEDLGTGVYNYTMVARDTLFHKTIDTVFVTVIQMPTVFPIWLITVGIGVVAVVVVAVVMMMRRR